MMADMVANYVASYNILCDNVSVIKITRTVSPDTVLYPLHTLSRYTELIFFWFTALAGWLSPPTSTFKSLNIGHHPC